MLERIGTNHGSIFSLSEPGKNPLSSVEIVGLVIIILLYWRLKNWSKAIWTANNVLPEPAFPTTKLKGCFNISVFAFFCSFDKVSENFIEPFGGFFFSILFWHIM